MNCASCSAPIQIKPEITQFVCAYCGSSQIVDRSGGVVTLNLVADAIHQVQRGTDRTAAELALVRLRKKQSILQNELDSLGWPRKPKRDRPADWPVCAKVSKWIIPSFLTKDPVKYPWYEDGSGLTLFRDPSKGPNIFETIIEWQQYDHLIHHFEINTPRAKQAHNEMIELEKEISHNEAIVKQG
jgi:hypothetical protein